MVSATVIAFILVVVLAATFGFALYISPYPVAPFTADGTHIGDFAFGNTYYNIFHFIFGSEVDGIWVTPNGMVQYLLLPFFAIALVMYGVLSEIPLGGNVPWFNTAMALIIALVVSSSGITVRAMRGYLTIAGNMAIAFFGFILVVGIGLQGLRRMGAMGIIPMGALKSVVNEAEDRQYVMRMIDAATIYARVNQGNSNKNIAKNVIKVIKLAAEAGEKLNKGDLNGAKQVANAIKGII